MFLNNSVMMSNDDVFTAHDTNNGRAFRKRLLFQGTSHDL